jgi:hypothetical protein
VGVRKAPGEQSRCRGSWPLSSRGLLTLALGLDPLPDGLCPYCVDKPPPCSSKVIRREKCVYTNVAVVADVAISAVAVSLNNVLKGEFVLEDPVPSVGFQVKFTLAFCSLKANVYKYERTCSFKANIYE